MAPATSDPHVERALAFVSEFKGDPRCALNYLHAEALAAEVYRLRAQMLDLQSAAEDARTTALWDADYAKGDIEQAHAKTVAMFGSTMARQAADYMAECLMEPHR